MWTTHTNHKCPPSQVQAWAKLGKKLSPCPTSQKTLMLTQAKLWELDITKTNSLDYLGFDLDGQNSIKFLIYMMMGSRKYVLE